MRLSTEIANQVTRLGGLSTDGQLESVQWPTGTFNWSPARIRSQFPDLADVDEYAMEDYIRPVRDLEFVTSDSGFWPGWEKDFQGTDSSRFHPFSSDEAFFYFIDSSCSSDNPDIYYVDHESTNEEPYHPESYTLETFLRVLE